MSAHEILHAEILVAGFTLAVFLYFRALVFCADMICGGLAHALRMVKEDFTFV